MIYLYYNGKVEIKNDEDSSGTYTVVERAIEPQQEYFDPTKPVPIDAMTETHTKKLPVYRIPLSQTKFNNKTHAFVAAENIEEAVKVFQAPFSDTTYFNPKSLFIEVDAKRPSTNNLININLWVNCRLIDTCYFDEYEILTMPLEHFLIRIKNTLTKITKLFRLEKEALEDFFTEICTFANWRCNMSADEIEKERMSIRFRVNENDISGLLKYYIEDNHPLA